MPTKGVSFPGENLVLKDDYEKAAKLIKKYGLVKDASADVTAIKEFITSYGENIRILNEYVKMWNERPFANKPVINKDGLILLPASYHIEVIDGETKYTHVDVIDNHGTRAKINVDDLMLYTPQSEVLYGKK